MNITLQNVKDFHTAFNHPIGDFIQFGINPDLKKLRHSLIAEEYKELADAEADNDVVETADAICDLKYVNNGAIIVHGLHPYWDEMKINNAARIAEEPDFKIDDYLNTNDSTVIIDVLLKVDQFIDRKIEEHGLTEAFPELFAEVQASNMSKLCVDEVEAEASVEKYKQDGVETEYIPYLGKFVILRSSDKKALKNINWSEPNLKPILVKYGLIKP
jgi:predicted HAD superfamily Cof-like phosphohydrolase